MSSPHNSSEKIRKKAQIWLIHPQRRQLILFKTNLQRGGFWQPITGSVEQGESYLQGALRETQEESGIELSQIHELGHEFSFLSRWGDQAVEQVFYSVLSHETSPKLSHEHSEWRWVDFDQAQELLSHESFKESLSLLRTKGILLFLGLFFMFMSVSSFIGNQCFAAQWARVIPEDSFIYTNPSERSPVLEIKHRDDIVLISEESMDRFFKVRTGNGSVASEKLGWIKKNEVLLPGQREHFLQHELDPGGLTQRSWRPTETDSRFGFFIGSGLGFLFPTSLNLILGRSQWGAVRGVPFVGQLLYLHSKQWELLARYEWLQTHNVFGSYEMQHRMQTFSLGAGYVAWRPKNAKLSFEFLGGLGPMDRLRVTAKDNFTDPNFAEVRSWIPSLTTDVYFRYLLGSRLSLGLCTGFKWAQSLRMKSLNQSFNGDSPTFENSGSLARFRMVEHLWFALLAVGAEF